MHDDEAWCKKVKGIPVNKLFCKYNPCKDVQLPMDRGMAPSK